MTANQIANASLLEAKRHNIVSEEEINRHNQSMEDIEYDRLQLQQYYDTWKLEYDHQYQLAVVANEKEANNIKQQLADLEDYYKTESLAISRREEWELEQWHDVQQKLQEIDLKLQDKKLEYQAHQWDEANAISWADINLRRDYNNANVALGWKGLEFKQQELDLSKLNFDLNYLKAQQNYNLGLQELTYKFDTLGLEQQKWNTQKELLTSQTWSNYINSTTGGLRNLFGIGSDLIKLGF